MVTPEITVPLIGVKAGVGVGVLVAVGVGVLVAPGMLVGVGVAVTDAVGVAVAETVGVAVAAPAGGVGVTIVSPKVGINASKDEEIEFSESVIFTDMPSTVNSVCEGVPGLKMNSTDVSVELDSLTSAVVSLFSIVD